MHLDRQGITFLGYLCLVQSFCLPCTQIQSSLDCCMTVCMTHHDPQLTVFKGS